MSKHTPGPWHAETHPNPGMGWDVYSTGPIHEVMAGYVREEANAHLIASAPELLEACRRLVEAHFDRPVQQWATSAVIEAKAAIAKAEGR